MEINDLAQKLNDARSYKSILNSPLVAFIDKRIHDYEISLYTDADNVLQLELVARIKELKELRLRITKQANKVPELEMKLTEAGVSV